MSWRDEYMQALRERDVESRSNYELIEACNVTRLPHHKSDTDEHNTDTKLIDRTIALEAEKAASLEGTSQQAALPKEAVLQSTSTTSRNEVVPLSQLKLQSALAETIRQKGQLESRLKDAEAELLKAKLHIKNDTETIRELTSDKSTLSIRLKDKNEELRGKAKLLEVCCHLLIFLP